MLENPEVLRKSADDFLNRAAVTDAGLLASPSQIAMTAVLNSASRAGLNMERWVHCWDVLTSTPVYHIPNILWRWVLGAQQKV